MKRTRIIAVAIMAMAALTLGGCIFPDPIPDSIQSTLSIIAPAEVHPPCKVKITADGIDGVGQYTFNIGGVEDTNSTPFRYADLVDLPSMDEPLIVTVTWTDGIDTQTATAVIALRNRGPVIGSPRFNGMYAYEFHAFDQARRVKVTFPDAYDPEGDTFNVTDATVHSVEWGKDLSIFCPPFIGVNPPKPDVYHVGQTKNAFVFYTYWSSKLQVTTELPLYPFGHSESTYQSTSSCEGSIQYWPDTEIARGDVIITATFEDEKGGTTDGRWIIPISPYSPCGGVQSPSSVL